MLQTFKKDTEKRLHMYRF